MLSVIDLCAPQGVAVAPHSPYFGPGFIATLHIIAADARKPLVEVLWLDMEANPFHPSSCGRRSCPAAARAGPRLRSRSRGRCTAIGPATTTRTSEGVS